MASLDHPDPDTSGSETRLRTRMVSARTRTLGWMLLGVACCLASVWLLPVAPLLSILLGVLAAGWGLCKGLAACSEFERSYRDLASARRMRRRAARLARRKAKKTVKQPVLQGP